MKALVYEGPGLKSWKDVPDPAVQDDSDAVIRVDATTADPRAREGLREAALSLGSVRSASLSHE